MTVVTVLAFCFTDPLSTVLCHHRDLLYVKRYCFIFYELFSCRYIREMLFSRFVCQQIWILQFHRVNAVCFTAVNCVYWATFALYRVCLRCFCSAQHTKYITFLSMFAPRRSTVVYYTTQSEVTGLNRFALTYS